MKKQDKEFLQLVLEEAHTLKEHATSDELSNIQIGNLDPDSARKCIYGLMTGHCDSPRAISLLGSCAVPFTSSLDQIDKSSIVEPTFNYKGNPFLSANLSIRSWFSPIELYIYHAEDLGQSLVYFLNGKKDKLTMKDLSVNWDEDYFYDEDEDGFN